MARLSSVIFWFCFGVLSIVFYPIAVLIWLFTMPFDRRKVLLHKFTCFWAGMFTYMSPNWSVTIEGKKPTNRNQTRVIVSNHLSLLDIPVVFRTYLHFKWVSKIENFKIPFIGWNMRMNRYIALARGSNKSNAKMIKDCEKTLSEGNSVYIFPEGTRSATGITGKFRRGAFEVARRAAMPILPIVIDGSSQALPKHGLIVRGYHKIRVRILDEILPESFANLSADELAEKVQGIISTEYMRMQDEKA